MDRWLYHFFKSNHRIRNIILFFSRGPVFNIFNKSFIRILFDSIKKQSVNIDVLKIDYSLKNTQNHIGAGIRWFVENQKLQPDDGITSFIEFKLSKLILTPSFPEVTGYILPTLFEYNKIFNSEEVNQTALRAADWELTLQNPEGSFPGGEIGNLTYSSVFNTAQIVHGLLRTFIETENQKYLDACERACDWMVSVQENDGAWRKYNYKSLGRTYDTKVAEAIIQTYSILNKEKYLDAVNKQIDFVELNQTANGWFNNCDNSIERNYEPLMHLIGYTVHGLLECNKVVPNDKAVSIALKTLSKLVDLFEISKKPLSGRYDSNWQPTVKSSCVTGDAQIAISWFMAFEITQDTRFLNAALKMNDFLKYIQFFKYDNRIEGSIPQSFPFWGDYGPYKINSWGIKYYVDALIHEYKFKSRFNDDDKR